MSSFFQGTDPDVDEGGAASSAQLARDWAIKLDGPVEGTSYSAEYNANLSRSYAVDSVAEAQAAAVSAQAAADSAAALGSIILDDIVDVSAPAPNSGDVLAWNATNSAWEPVAPVIAVNQQVNDLWARITTLEAKLTSLGLLP